MSITLIMLALPLATGCTSAPARDVARPQPDGRTIAPQEDRTTPDSGQQTIAPQKDRIVLDPAGRAIAPSNAPRAVKQMVAAANRIVGLPYRYFRGHAPYKDVPIDTAYDGSGATSYMLHAAGLLRRPHLAHELARFGEQGRGKWATIMACEDGAHIVVAGMAFDTHLDRRTLRGRAFARWLKPYKRYDCIARHPRGL